MRLAALMLLALVAPACAFKTDGIDDVMGTSCSHYVADTFTTEPGQRCWAVRGGSGQCFYREAADPTCARPPQLFAPGAELVMWCPLESRGEDLEFVPADCELM